MSIIHIPFYPSEWLAGTRGLSDAETGVYITLIAKMYEMAGPIERDDDRLYRVCGCSSKASFLKSLNYLISEGKIIETPDGIFNEKVEKVIKITTEKSDKAKAAAQSRWDRKPSKNNKAIDANASPKHMPEGCQLELEVKLEEDIGKPISCSFDEFWSLWPNKVGKQNASKAWKKLSLPDRKRATDAVLGGWFERWRISQPSASPIHAASYLNGKRFFDEIEPASLQPKNTTADIFNRVMGPN